MIYTKSQAIEQVYLKVNGGKTTQQATVKREDIELYLMAAVAFVWGQDMKERVQQAILYKRLGMESSVSFDDIRTTEYITPQYDKRKDEHYIEVGEINTVNGMQTWDLLPVQGFYDIKKVNSRSDLSGLDDVVDGIVFAYYITNPTARIYIVNLPRTCELEFTRNVDFSAIGDDEALPVPDDKQKLVIDYCVEYFTGQKLMPDDKQINNEDNKGK